MKEGIEEKQSPVGSSIQDRIPRPWKSRTKLELHFVGVYFSPIAYLDKRRTRWARAGYC